ncbi:MAG: hypothetical protein WAN87_09760 [Thermoplasmata archaeon]
MSANADSSPPARSSTPAKTARSKKKGFSVFDVEAQEKQAALQEPGPSWHEWFFFSASKMWIGIGMLIVDTWIVVTFTEMGNYVALGLALAAALYADFLLFRYLWYRPDPHTPSSRGPFRPTWFRPVQYGRWTPEAERIRMGMPVAAPDTGPDPREFL